MIDKAVFWGRWLKGDDLMRLDMIKSLSVCDDIKYGKLDKKTSKHVVATLINSYLEDLKDTIAYEH